jgi:hypothetical protein
MLRSMNYFKPGEMRKGSHVVGGNNGGNGTHVQNVHEATDDGHINARGMGT